MRYRQLDANGDRVFGQGLASFYINTPQAVAQAVATRLKLFEGEWFYDITDGTPWNTQVLGRYTQGTRDRVIKSRVSETIGVQSYSNYVSSYDGGVRSFTVSLTLQTVYGQVVLEGAI